MDLVSTSSRVKFFLKQLTIYCSFALVIFIPYIINENPSSHTLKSLELCRNHDLLCAPALYNNLISILNFFIGASSFEVLNTISLFSLFIIFWFRLLKFGQRIKFLKLMGVLLLLLSPFTLSLLANPESAILSAVLFILISIGFETINHGLIIRGILTCSSVLPFLILNGIYGFVIGIITPSFFYFTVKWHILKKYTWVSYILLLFPTIGIVFGIVYLCLIFDNSVAQTFMNSNINIENFEILFNWFIFIPLFFIYYFKNKKGLNQVKRFVIPIFFIANCFLFFLETSYVQKELFGMCTLCFSFEVISDAKFSQRSFYLIVAFFLLSWIANSFSLITNFLV